MLKRLSATRRSCVELFLSLFLTKLNLLNERSADATVTSSVDVECFRIPVPVSWAYVVVNGKALYNSYAAVDFELHRAEEDTLVNKILELAGITIGKPGLSQVGTSGEVAEMGKQNVR